MVFNVAALRLLVFDFHCAAQFVMFLLFWYFNLDKLYFLSFTVPLVPLMLPKHSCAVSVQ